jgi:hypothetical protein
MSFTRFHDDPQRIQKQVDESSFAGRYALDTPGPGIAMPFFEDPQMRLQYWGANVMTNSVNLESDLRGLTRKLNRDETVYNNYKISALHGTPLNFASESSFIDESRASHPAWMFRDIEQTRWEEPIINPQANLEKKFVDNVQTRILEKDYFVPSIPILEGANDYYLHGPSICTGQNCRN